MRMLSRNGLLALLAVFGILLVFFFPASCGPFSVTNGPATAFRALELARGVFAAMSVLLLVLLLQCNCREELQVRIVVNTVDDPALLNLRC